LKIILKLVQFFKQRTTASIPSKFETTLHVGFREQDAFGGRVHRFKPAEVSSLGCFKYLSLTLSRTSFLARGPTISQTQWCGRQVLVDQYHSWAMGLALSQRFSFAVAHRIALTQYRPTDFRTAKSGRLCFSQGQGSMEFQGCVMSFTCSLCLRWSTHMFTQHTACVWCCDSNLLLLIFLF
jgi:hypothetical protein